MSKTLQQIISETEVRVSQLTMEFTSTSDLGSDYDYTEGLIDAYSILLSQLKELVKE